jgi:hypothetical protein
MRLLRVFVVSVVAGSALLLGVPDASPAGSPPGHWVITDLGSGEAQAINERARSSEPSTVTHPCGSGVGGLTWAR